MQLELLPEDLARQTGAQCLDHSPAGYYMREQDPKRWVIFLEGGGLCVEPIDCLGRLKSHQGSSKYWDPNKLPEGASTTSLSPLNPLANWSHVYVPYCSGDTWLGGSSKGHPVLLGMQMSGHLIIETLVERLINQTQFGDASEIVLSGSSAGGIGAFHHTDWLGDRMEAHARQVNAAPPRVVGFPIEGLFFPEKWPVLYEQFIIGNTAPVANFMSSYLKLLQNPWFQPACVDASKRYGFNKADCFNVFTAVNYTMRPLFIGMNRFDKLLVQDLGLCLGCKASDQAGSHRGNFIRFYGARMNQTVLDISKALPQTGWFVPSEFHHDENFYEFLDAREKRINGVSLRSAFESWYHDRKTVRLLETTCQTDGPCNDSVELLPKQHSPGAAFVV